MSDYQLRFGGIARLYGQNALKKFQQAHVIVVGIGGVGSWVAEALARSGIGELTLIDLDDICITNTNRQIHALTHTIGQDKITVMAERITAINPECHVNLIDDFVTIDNLSDLITNKHQVVIDAIDSVPVKAAMIAHCKRHKIKLICIGGAGGQTDPTQIHITDLSKTYQDPLLAKVRNLLRRQYNFPRDVKKKFGVDAVFSTEQLVYPDQEGNVCHAKQAQNGTMKLDCNQGFGAATHVTASFAFVAVARALKHLAKSL
jgi:tRNA A37 threonylcarbamoyladenosine dehydratase